MASSYFILKNGIAPPELRQQPEAVRLVFWRMVVDLGLKRKDWELARGLNAKGEPLPGVAAATRKNRKSEMTPSGKGDPRAPYLMPGRGLSRTRSLLAGKPHADYAEFFWRYDAWTGDQWGKILAHHARRGTSYNVVGLSPKGVAWVAAMAQKRWRDYLAGRYVEPIVTPQQAAASLPFETPGRTNLDFATFGIGGTEDQARRAIAEGRSSGFMGRAEWEAYFRSRRPSIAPGPGQAPSVTRGASNVLLQSIWNVPRTPPPTPMRKAAMGPIAPPRPRRPATPPPVPVRTYGDASEADAAVARRVYRSLPAWARAQLEAAGVEVSVGGEMADVLPGRAGESARGYPAGATLANAGGVYVDDGRRAVACRTRVDLESGERVRVEDARLAGTVRHELGHAVDFTARLDESSYLRVTSRPGFAEAYRADVLGMPESSRRVNAYYLQERGGDEEAFAETFAEVLHRRTDPDARAYMDVFFPRVYAWVLRLFEEGMIL